MFIFIFIYIYIYIYISLAQASNQASKQAPPRTRGAPRGTREAPTMTRGGSRPGHGGAHRDTLGYLIPRGTLQGPADGYPGGYSKPRAPAALQASKQAGALSQPSKQASKQVRRLASKYSCKQASLPPLPSTTHTPPIYLFITGMPSKAPQRWQAFALQGLCSVALKEAS